MKKILLIPFLLLLIGCSTKPIIQKEIVVKRVYVKSKCPKLKVFDVYNRDVSLTAYNNNGKVCVKEWNACIPKEQMINLISYIRYLKEVNNKYRKEIEEYNKNYSVPRKN
jgi:uncharacterized protein YxeA